MPVEDVVGRGEIGIIKGQQPHIEVVRIEPVQFSVEQSISR